MQNQSQKQVEARFTDYFEVWMQKIEVYLQEVLTVQRDSSHEEQHRLLVGKVMNLFKDFYTEKWTAARGDVLCFFNQPWLTPLENANTWVTGWKPSMVFRLITSLKETQVPNLNLGSLTEDQLKKIENLRLRTSKEEGQVEREMERKQVCLADREMVKLAKITSRVTEAEMSEEVKGLVDRAVSSLFGSLEKIMKTADCVRLRAFSDVLHALTPLQAVDFIAAILMVHVQLRKWGKRTNYYTRI